MTRADLLLLVIAQARANGFEFRRWFTSRLNLPWTTPTAAVALLDSERRYYALLFAHDFARSFWKGGTDMTLAVPNQTFQRLGKDGVTLTVTRKAYTRRRVREDAWQYHLQQMAIADEPLRYIRRFLRVEDELTLPPDPDPVVIIDEEDLLPED